MDAIREVIVTLYLAMAYAGGPQWLEMANEMLAENANDPEIDGEAAHMLRVLSEQTRDLFPKPLASQLITEQTNALCSLATVH